MAKYIAIDSQNKRHEVEATNIRSAKKKLSELNPELDFEIFQAKNAPKRMSLEMIRDIQENFKNSPHYIPVALMLYDGLEKDLI